MAKIFTHQSCVANYTRSPNGTALVYNENIPPDRAVCLAMPPREAPYFSAKGDAEKFLLPFFEMNLPEGAFRQMLDSLFQERFPSYDKMILLEIVGHSTVGRVRVLNEAENDPPLQSEINITDLLEQNEGEEIFNDLFRRFADSAGISGAQPKLLVRDNKISDTRLTIREATHILKAFDSKKFPHLAVNELLCLLAAEEARLPTAKARLSKDGSLLAIERFDIREDGTFWGFEDACSLALLYPREKYHGSYEQVAGTFKQTLSTSQNLRDEMKKLFMSIALSIAVRNGDAHRKNFGLIYESPASPSRFFAPVYDVVTTTHYFHTDKMALTLNGTKGWASRKKLLNFGLRYCLLSVHEAAEALDVVCGAVDSVRQKVKHGEIELPNGTQETITKILEEWGKGLCELSAAKI
jgi:serine/threonine-protein kinase HipA